MRRNAAATLLTMLLSSCFAAPLAWGGNPIPGVGIVVKRNPGTSSALVVPGGFFGPGSQPFSGTVGLQGRCSQDCGGCDSDCGGGPPDGRLDYAADSPAGPFEMSLTAMTLYSTEPIPVQIGGATSFFDVFFEISGPGPQADDAIPGTLTIPAGVSLDPGTTTTVASSSLVLRATITFADHATGTSAGGALQRDLELAVQNVVEPLDRTQGLGTPSHIVLGSNGATVKPVTYASAGGELQFRILSLEPGLPVGTRARSWGALKTIHR